MALSERNCSTEHSFEWHGIVAAVFLRKRTVHIARDGHVVARAESDLTSVLQRLQDDVLDVDTG